jgi:tRNA-dihydrouridine synthase
MQDVTDLVFWDLQAEYGEPDLHFTPYFRVHATSRLNRSLLHSITHSPAHRRVVAQIIGEDIPALVRTARELQHYPIAAVDFNLGCPAPLVCRKHVGGGLLRQLDRVHAILAALRETVTLPLTVKTRLGFASPEAFDELLGLFRATKIDLVTIHCRTVNQMYDGVADHGWIARAVQLLPCPVLANGDIASPRQALSVLARTGAHGLMIGRGAVRNPWIFQQIRQVLAQQRHVNPTGRQVFDYIEKLFQRTRSPDGAERPHVERMKKYLNFIGPGIEPTGQFLRQIQRAATAAEFFRACARWLAHDHPMALESLRALDSP